MCSKVVSKEYLLFARWWTFFCFCGFLFGLHYGAGWSWQVSMGIALLDEIATKLYIISRQLDR